MGSEPRRFDDTIAVVTGGGAGVGRATAQLLAHEGATVAVLDVDGEAATATVKAIEAVDGQALGLATDVRDRDQVDAGFADVAAALGPVGVLVNCAGGSRDDDGPLDVTDPDAFDAALDASLALDLRGTLHCCRAAGAQMQAAEGGAIVNLASFHAVGGDSPVHAYTVAKGGVLAATRALAARYGPQRIRVNAVAAGIVLTDRVVRRVAHRGVDLDAVRARHPFSVGEPEALARTIAFLASSDAQMVTGVTLVADGGLTLY